MEVITYCLKNLNYGTEIEYQAYDEPNEPKNEPNETIPDSIAKMTDLDEREKRVLSLIYNNTKIARTDIVGATGYSMATVKRILSALRDKKILSREGSTRNGVWVIK